MAEGWARYLKNDEIEAYSAGIEKHGVNPKAIAVMAEAGVDIAHQRSKNLSELVVQEFDWIITLCGHAAETCPWLPGRKIHKGFEDPPRLAAVLAERGAGVEDQLDCYRRVRDEIRAFVATLPEVLAVYPLEKPVEKLT
jgi:arsenate reductase